MKQHDVSSISCNSAAAVRMVHLGDVDVDFAQVQYPALSTFCRVVVISTALLPRPSPRLSNTGRLSLDEECDADAGSMFGRLRRPSHPTAEGMTRSESSSIADPSPPARGVTSRGSAPSSAGGRGHVELLLGLLRLGLGAEGLGLYTSPWRSGRQERTRLGRQRYP